MIQKKDIKIGTKFGFLEIINEEKSIRYKGGQFKRRFKCKCDCENFVVVILGDLVSGHTKSCGCMKSTFLKDINTTHGLSRSSIYQIWQGMLKRCENKKCFFFKNYGGRGIKVCDKWHNFEGFWEDVKEGYSDKLSLDRIDNNGNYCKENCRWITQKKQMRNTRANVNITHDGKTKCVTEWIEEMEIKTKPATIYARIYYGWSPEKALLTPVR